MHLAALDDIETAIASIEAGAARMDEVTLDLGETRCSCPGIA